MRLVRAFLLAVLLALTAKVAAAQCAMCKESLTAQADATGSNIAAGFNYSILTMISIPAVLACGLIALIVVNNRARTRSPSPQG